MKDRLGSWCVSYLAEAQQHGNVDVVFQVLSQLSEQPLPKSDPQARHKDSEQTKALAPPHFAQTWRIKKNVGLPMLLQSSPMSLCYGIDIHRGRVLSAGSLNLDSLFRGKQDEWKYWVFAFESYVGMMSLDLLDQLKLLLNRVARSTQPVADMTRLDQSNRDSSVAMCVLLVSTAKGKATLFVWNSPDRVVFCLPGNERAIATTMLLVL
eukprot:3095305-Amphidinium_carterae.1